MRKFKFVWNYWCCVFGGLIKYGILHKSGITALFLKPFIVVIGRSSTRSKPLFCNLVAKTIVFWRKRRDTVFSLFLAHLGNTLSKSLETCWRHCFCFLPDIDECASNKGGCSHTCVNLNGTYLCACPPGYEVDSSTKRVCQGRKKLYGVKISKVPWRVM